MGGRAGQVLAPAAHTLKLEQYRRDYHGPSTKDDRKIREVYHIFLELSPPHPVSVELYCNPKLSVKMVPSFLKKKENLGMLLHNCNASISKMDASRLPRVLGHSGLRYETLSQKT